MNPFFIIFIGLPALEIFLLIKIGGHIGALSTVSIIFITAIIGVYYAKLQGIQTLKSGMLNMYQNKMPIYDIISGATIALAALFLIIPGFLTDFFGFLLLIPLTRKIILSMTLKSQIKTNTKNQEEVIEGEIIDKKKDEL